MRRRNKRKKSYSSRGRRVSGVSKEAVIDLAAIAVGVIAGNMIAKKVSDNVTSVDPKIVNGGTAVAGLVVAKKGRGIIANIGKGVFVAGALGLTKEFAPNLIAGAGDLVTFDNNSLRGFPEMSLIGRTGVGATGPNFQEMSVIGNYNPAYGLH